MLCLVKDFNYFDSFVRMVDYSCHAADLLNEIMNNFNPDVLHDKTVKMHSIEYQGDQERHEMIRNLLHEFITLLNGKTSWPSPTRSIRSQIQLRTF